MRSIVAAARHLRLGVAVFALITLLTEAPAAAGGIEINAQSVVLDESDPARRVVGALTYRGGLNLSSSDRSFGGFSGLDVSPDGRSLTAVSDRGHVLTARLTYNRDGSLAGIGEGRLDPLVGPDGRPLSGRRLTDAESLTADGEGGWIVAFEQRHRLLRYGAWGEAPRLPRKPSGLSSGPRNGGIEALTRLRDGRLLAIAERHGTDQWVNAWISDIQGHQWRRLAYPTSDKFRPTGAATLPDGGVLVVERFFNLLGGLAARLKRVDVSEIKSNGTLVATEVAVLRPPLTVDNMEGVAVRRGAAGETVIYLMSDDNFFPLQRTLLLMFILESGP